ncbi:hypothetical protein HYFRA_00008464 [Hymenoscyphus fraxineus]|uniref:Major facilitator superfamily (MFS) profile domain-containing protein n=1 Tax=Hymenoscyphus fraxineus TaxID=746836 RepID=A0A9N9PKR6_9HELO|nr:hypothetical protein HYFRA_00008464 [Hymenoscyphus fraxineus]
MNSSRHSLQIHPDQPGAESVNEKKPVQDEGKVQEEEPEAFRHTWRVWCIFSVLWLLSFISAVDATIVTTSLPTIVRDIGGAEEYIWIANSFMFASTIPQPLFGQISNIFGRRNPMLVAIALLALGSGVASGSNSVTMLIAGRTIQGLGTGGLYVLSDVIICDIVPPRHRAPYLSAVLSAAVIGTTLGPIIGGALAEVEWRWIFRLNLPVSGISFIGIILLLNVKYKRSPTWKHTLTRVDFMGTGIFVPSMISIFFGVIMGGTHYSWGSYHIVVPLVLGVLGWILFHLHQASKFCKEPSTPSRLFKHRNSAAGFIIIFLGAVILQAISYFLPVYFQAVKGTSPLLSGVYFLPFALAIIPFAGFAGVFISKTGLYMPLHWAGFAMMAVGSGLLSLLDESSSQAAWVCYQIIASGGVGIVLTATLPSTLGALSEDDVAVATGTFSFIRSFGLVWGVTIASIVFNGQVASQLGGISDVHLRELLADGTAYSYASGGFISALSAGSKVEVINLYVEALRVVWLVLAGISCLGFICVFIEKHVELRKEHSTEFGLVEKEQASPET